MLNPIYTFLKKPQESRSLREISRIFNHCKEIEFFEKLLEDYPLEQVQKLWSKLTYLECEEDEFVFKIGGDGSTFYIILEGTVKILAPYSTEHEDTITNDPSQLLHEIGTLWAGQSFGELSIIYNTLRTASVQATSKCRLAVL